MYEQLTPGPVVAGTRFREVMSAGGQRIEMIREVTEHEPGRRFAWRSVSDGATEYGGGFTAVPLGDRTELRYEGWRRRRVRSRATKRRGPTRRSARRKRSSRASKAAVERAAVE